MDPLEALVAQIQGLSSTSSDVNRLHSILKQAEESLRSQSTRLPQLLTQLDPSIHSLGFLYILYVPKKIYYKRYLSMSKTLVLRLRELFYFDSFCDCREAYMTSPITKTQAETAIPIVTRFIGACSDQIRLAPERCMKI